MNNRKAEVFLLFIAFFFVLLLACISHAAISRSARVWEFREMAAMAQRYTLTDLALFTEARYTRNPSLADYYAAFQAHPMALEHFPSGSIVGPPEHLSGPVQPNREWGAIRPGGSTVPIEEVQ